MTHRPGGVRPHASFCGAFQNLPRSGVRIRLPRPANLPTATVAPRTGPDDDHVVIHGQLHAASPRQPTAVRQIDERSNRRHEDRRRDLSHIRFSSSAAARPRAPRRHVSSVRSGP